MILIDKPYVSEFLIRTIKENNFQIISSKEATSLISDKSLNWITEKEAKDIFANNNKIPIYTNSENTISWIQNNFASSKLPGQIQVFKNKIKLRELLSDYFPNYFFKGVKLEDLRTLSVEELNFPFIIKPAVGFFSIAVHKVENIKEWNSVLDKIELEIHELHNLFPKEVIDISDFIIEEYIEGEEYAIDFYFNNEGKPIVLNVLHHMFSSGKDVSDRIYTTSKKIIEKYADEILGFLKILGKKVNLKNFPAHIEIRVDERGKINPIEVNPLRFGGLCTTGDLAWYAYGVNSYEYFFLGKIPDWEGIFKTRKDKSYSIVILDNNSGIKISKIESFDYDLLLKDFENPLELRKMDVNEYSVFGILFTETASGNKEELDRILSSNLKKYIKVKNT